MPNAPIALPAMIAANADIQLSDPYVLKNAHPQSLAGACVHYAVQRGSRILFSLGRHDAAWHSAGGPFSRWAQVC